jgi:hypothetical protein
MMMRKTMRLRTCTKITVLSSVAVLLSGCSWLGIGGGQSSYQAHNNRYESSSQQYNAQNAQRLGRCQITSPAQRVPAGCRPEDVTLALGAPSNGYAQQAQYTNSGYGSHVDTAQSAQAGYSPQVKSKRPWLRGQFGLEIDHSVSGNIYDPGVSGTAAAYNRALFIEGNTAGSVASGQVVNTTYTSVAERIAAPTISFDDVYTAPLRVSGGLEVILSDHATVYANAGYTRAEGKKGGGVQIIDELRQIVSTSDYITDPAVGVVGSLIGTVNNTTFLPNEVVATYNYEFNDLERYDFEAGGRYYFNPILKSQLQRPLTPFVSASGGLAHYSATSVNENQQQRFIGRAFDGTQINTDGDFYDVNFGARTQIYDAQWVPYGAVKAGLEWQMTPKTALAFEAGVKYEGARDFSNGTQGDEIISIPVTIRGSYNF